MNIRYNTLFTVDFHHDFYVSGSTPDLVCIPTADTLRLMEQYKLRMRENKKEGSTGFFIAGRTTGSTPDAFITLPETMKFSFWVKVRNPDFHNFTELSNPPGTFWLFRNAPAPDDTLFMNSYSGYLKPINRRFTHTFSEVGGDTPDPATVEVWPTGAGTPAIVLHPSPDGDGNYSTEIDLSALPSGNYGILHTDPGYDVYDFAVYATHLPSAAGLLGVIDIHKGPGDMDFSFEEPRAFTLSFTRRSVLWKYFVVSTGTNPFALEDQASGAVAGSPYPWPMYIRPYDDLGYTLTGEDEKTIAFLTATYPAGSTVDLYLPSADDTGGSPLELPYFELPRKGIALVDTDSGTSAVMRRHVAVPALSDPKAEIIIVLETQHSI